uniref:Methyltransferase domain-containing protein n=1 Tax=Phaeomonas parva TaxID=124430 RepID=A0A7S1TVF5_9STRA|mmetsp:Transcript_19699/g.59653  ORF Transcript_19699/g.59653 Transcript_19699/m.59653 type:complete len:219 (+) Transcript_19699:330-986(+)
MRNANACVPPPPPAARRRHPCPSMAATELHVLGYALGIGLGVPIGMVLLYLVLVHSFSSGNDSFGGSIPYAWTPSDRVNRMLDIAPVLKGDIVYDLGCGDGRFILGAASRGAQAVGYDLAWFPYAQARFCALLFGQGRVRVERRDFWHADLSSATVVCVFLLPQQMVHLQRKLLREVSPGCRILAYRYGLPGWQSQDTGYNDVFKYVIGKGTPEPKGD